MSKVGRIMIHQTGRAAALFQVVVSLPKTPSTVRSLPLSPPIVVENPARLANAAMGVSVLPRRVAVGLFRRHELVSRRSLERPSDRPRRGRHSARQLGSTRQAVVRRRDVRGGGADRRRVVGRRSCRRSATGRPAQSARPCPTTSESATDESRRETAGVDDAVRVHSR
jgi:hypothetical protein